MRTVLETTPTTTPLSLAQRTVLGFIRMYQHTLSPDHGPLFQGSTLGCRFYPSCSEYTVRAVVRYGAVCGTAKGIQRILRCTPWAEGGVDDIN